MKLTKNKNIDLTKLQITFQFGMKKTLRGIEIFDGKHKRFGGHSQWLSRFTGLDYLIFQFGWWRPTYDHEWYDGQHHWLSFGPIRVCWGGKPFKDLN